MDRRCTQCHEVKPRTEFDVSGRNGLMSYCKACRRKMRRAAYVPHPRPRIPVQRGQRFGRLIILEETPPRNRSRRASCVCDCGNEVTVNVQSLFCGETTSCGCYHREVAIARNKSDEHRASMVTHGMTDHPLYPTWCGILARCEAPSHRAYRNYGGRGIAVWPPWHDAAAFIAWVEENLGPRAPTMTLDRIDNDGNYEPGNLRWATRSQQARNKRSREQLHADSARSATVGTERDDNPKRA